MNLEHKDDLKKNIIKHSTNTNEEIQNINCKLCNTLIKKSEYSKHYQQIDHTEYMINLIEQQSKQINNLTQKINSLVEYEKYYENVWIITDFMNKIDNNEVRIESPYIELYPYSFYISASKQYIQNSVTSLLNLTLIPSVAIKNEYSNKISVLFSLTLLNSKSSNNNINKSGVFEFDCDNLTGGAYTFNFNDINQDNGYIFQDSSIQFQFTISIKKKPFKS